MRKRLSKREKGIVQLKKGEVVRLRDRAGLFPDGIYQVEVLEFDLLKVRVGEIRLGVAVEQADIMARGLLEPVSWLAHEVAFRRAFLKSCDCEQCRRDLGEKEKLLQIEKRAALSFPSVPHAENQPIEPLEV